MSTRKVDEFIISTSVGDVRFVDREDVAIPDRKMITDNVRIALADIPGTPLCIPRAEGDVVKQAFRDHAADLRSGRITRRELFTQIQPELDTARRGESCYGDFEALNFLLTRPGQTQALGAWNMYFILDRGTRLGVQLIESSVMPGIPNAGKGSWHQLTSEIYRWFLFNTFTVDGTPYRVMQWTFPSADVGPEWDWAGTQAGVTWLRRNGVTVTLHQNTPLQDRYGAVLIHTMVRT